MKRAQLIFAWYDLWVGLYWDRLDHVLYLFPVPCLGIRLDLSGLLCSLGHHPCLSVERAPFYGALDCHCNRCGRVWRAREIRKEAK
jgi:hypothetical protein